jgi:serine/threonine protein kinase
MPSNYSFVKRLGKGSQGDVWLAVDSDANQLVAVKVGAARGGLEAAAESRGTSLWGKGFGVTPSVAAAQPRRRQSPSRASRQAS